MKRVTSLAAALLLAACASTSVPSETGERQGPKPAEVAETAGGVLKSILSFFSAAVVIR
jgi:uncharacterized lipoprotein YmbA